MRKAVRYAILFVSKKMDSREENKDINVHLADTFFKINLVRRKKKRI